MPEKFDLQEQAVTRLEGIEATVRDTIINNNTLAARYAGDKSVLDELDPSVRELSGIINISPFDLFNRFHNLTLFITWFTKEQIANNQFSNEELETLATSGIRSHTPNKIDNLPPETSPDHQSLQKSSLLIAKVLNLVVSDINIDQLMYNFQSSGTPGNFSEENVRGLVKSLSGILQSSGREADAIRASLDKAKAQFMGIISFEFEDVAAINIPLLGRFFQPFKTAVEVETRPTVVDLYSNIIYNVSSVLNMVLMYTGSDEFMQEQIITMIQDLPKVSEL